MFDYFQIITLECSHIFCLWCLKTWMSRTKQCLICKVPIKNFNDIVGTGSKKEHAKAKKSVSA